MRTSLHKNPCVRDCAGRYPGCCCQHRLAWLEEHQKQKRQQRAETTLAGYQRDAKRDAKDRHKERHDWRHQ